MDENHFAEVPLVYGPETIIGPKYRTWVRADAGTAKVVTLNGVYRETLWPGNAGCLPGGYWLGRYMPLTECKIYTVDTKDKRLPVEADVIIHDPAHIKVHLEVTIFYRVCWPEIVALQIDTPLQSLRDWTIDAMHTAIKQLEYAEFLKGGRAPDDILQFLKQNGVEEYFGFQIFKVTINDIDAELPPNWMDLMKDPEVGKALRAWFGSGIDPRQFVKYPHSVQGPQVLLGQESMLGRPSTYPQLGDGGTSAVYIAKERLQNECATLFDREYEPSLRKDGDGYYLIEVTRNDPDEHHLRLAFVCRESYPEYPPQVVFVDVDGLEQNFSSSTVDNWSSQHTICEIVEEARSFFNR